MHWLNLFSTARIGQANKKEPSARSEYQRDCDRIMFSAAFRRLQDKTQVFPLEKNDYVRTRLTHSLEVACVGRSLGSSAGAALLEKYHDLAETGLSRADIGDIVAAACLAHDLGNPPFGHAGEQAMRDFFLSDKGGEILSRLDLDAAETADLKNIEGNAQGFRICNRLESPDNKGGLRLTATTLASAAKYPTTADARPDTRYKKNGVYRDDLTDYSEVFHCLGLRRLSDSAWQRHPLSFLTEAADDICYLIIDIEDAYQVGQICFDDARGLLFTLAGDLIDKERLDRMHSRTDQLSYLRAKAIGHLVRETVAVFLEKESALRNGSHCKALIANIPSSAALDALRDYAEKQVYLSRPVLEVQIAGHRVLNGLMDIFASAVMAIERHGKPARRRERMLIELLPSRYRRYNVSPYQHLLAVCDYIAGMSDSYAVSLYKKLTGISLPVN